MITGHQLVHAHWARIIAWDPYWIKRRDASSKGWTQTQNYYGACVAMAAKALAEVAGDPTLGITPAEWDKYGLPKLQARLNWLQANLKNKAVAQPLTASPTAPVSTRDSSLDLWTCYESSQDVTGLELCRISAAGPRPGSGLAAVAAAAKSLSNEDLWQSYNNERYGWNLLRLAASAKGRLSEPLLSRLTQQFDKMDAEDHFTRFDYQPETRLWKSLLNQSMPIEKAVEKTQSEFPDVKLSH